MKNQLISQSPSPIMLLRQRAFQSMNLKERSRKMLVSNIPTSKEFRKDVSVMCNLSQGIVDDTKAEIILNMFKKGYTLEQIADVTEKSISEIEKIVKKEPAMA